uniref:Large ribosomal subunit protein eL31 n=1 Tax=Capra hircus TaxID=9925 RepID=A0A8C2NRA7_CAPHI
MTPTKMGDENKTIQPFWLVMRKYTINIHECIHRVSIKKCAPQALKEIQKFAIKETECPDVPIDTGLNKAVRTKGIRTVPYCICVWLSKNHNEDEYSINKLNTLVT